MAKVINRLPISFLAKEHAPGKYHDGGGLYVYVKPSGAMQFVLRYTNPKTGKRSDMGLGSCKTYTLEEAREKARLARQDTCTSSIP
jgi:hypothetical protein